jgi:hypothetical protein
MRRGATLSSFTSVEGISAPVGQACTHSPHATQVDCAHRVVEVEHDLFVVAAPGHADHVVDLHFAAGADAQIALDAGVEIDRHRGLAAVRRGALRARGQAARRDPMRSAQDQNFEAGSCACVLRSG